MHNLCTDKIRTATKLHMHTLKIHSMIYQNAVKIMEPSSSGSICTMCDRKPFTFSLSTPETKNRLRENCIRWSLRPWLQRGDTNTLDSTHFVFYSETSIRNEDDEHQAHLVPILSTSWFLIEARVPSPSTDGNIPGGKWFRLRSSLLVNRLLAVWLLIWINNPFHGCVGRFLKDFRSFPFDRMLMTVWFRFKFINKNVWAVVLSANCWLRQLNKNDFGFLFTPT